MGEFQGTEQIISAKQNPKQEMAIYSLLQRRDVMEILSTSFG